MWRKKNMTLTLLRCSVKTAVLLRETCQIGKRVHPCSMLIIFSIKNGQLSCNWALKEWSYNLSMLNFYVRPTPSVLHTHASKPINISHKAFVWYVRDSHLASSKCYGTNNMSSSKEKGELEYSFYSDQTLLNRHNDLRHNICISTK